MSVMADCIWECGTPDPAVCRTALAEGNFKALAELMNQNFDLRRSMFGDAALGATNLEMISLARSVGGEAITLFALSFVPAGVDLLLAF